MRISQVDSSSDGDPNLRPSGIGAIGGAVAGGALGTILGPVGTLGGGLLGIVVGDKYEQRQLNPRHRVHAAANQEKSDTEASERVIVRATSDIGEIMGADERTYQLQEGDVVTLPTVNADPLIKKGAAVEVDDDTEDVSEAVESSLGNSDNDGNGDDNKISLAEIQAILEREKDSNHLTEIPDDFYNKIREYFQIDEANDLGEVINKITHAESNDNNLDEAAEVKELVEEICERRGKKILSHAAIIAAGKTPVDDHLTEVEQESLEKVLERIDDTENLKQTSFDVNDSLTNKKTNSSGESEEEIDSSAQLLPDDA